MAQYTGVQSILDAALGGYYYHLGFWLISIGDYELLLSYQGIPLGVIVNSGAFLQLIRDACQEHLESIGAN